MVQHDFVARVAVLAFRPWKAGEPRSVDGVEPLPGGGPIEAFYRLITHQNVVSPLEPGWRTDVIQSLDKVIEGMLQAVVTILPDFAAFNLDDYVADGYNVPEVVILKSACRMMAYLLPVFLVGYFFLKTREVAK